MKSSPDLSIEVEDLSGRTWSWSQDERAAQDVPANLSFASRRGDGFAELSVTLHRPIVRDFPDLGLLNTMRVVGQDGSVAWEGRITAFPRSSADGGSFNVTGAGWMSHATDRTFRQIYADRDLARWGSVSVERKANLLAGDFAYSEATATPDKTTGQPSLELGFDGGWDSPAKPGVWASYDAGGLPIGSLYYAWKNPENLSNANFLWEARLSDDDINTTLDATGDLQAAGPGSGTLTATDTREFAEVTFQFGSTPGGTDGVHYAIFWTVLAVYGDHGLEKQGSDSQTTAQGFYASDVIADIVSRYAPKLDPSGIQDTSYAIEQLAFTEPTTPFKAIGQVNGFHQWELAVWEDRIFYFAEPKPLDDWDWEVRTDDPETVFSPQGDSIEDLRNGIVVRFTNLVDGREEELSPADYEELADGSPENPANIAGIEMWGEPLSVPFSTTTADAVQYGAAKLGEASRPKAPGEITTGPHIRDRQGNHQPAWKVRAGDRVVISDHPNDAPRRVTEARWDDTQKGLSISVDLTSQRLEALFARIAQGRLARGLG